MTGNRGLTRQILGLAVPAFFALVAEPLFLLVDSAIVGHLGTPQLAGLGVAGSVLGTAAGVFVFLAYGTTASVARALGAGADLPGAEPGVAAAGRGHRRRHVGRPARWRGAGRGADLLLPIARQAAIGG